MENVGREADPELLFQGNAPLSGQRIREMSVGIDFLTDFWTEKYLQEYICQGGSKIKFVTGRPGSGKSHFLRLFSEIAGEMGYRTVQFSAREIWLHDFKEIYAEIFRQCDIMKCLKGCACRIVKAVGYDQKDIPEGMTFMDYLSQMDMGDAITKREIRLQLKKMFLDNPLMDNNFALSCSLLTGGILGHPMLESQNQELLLGWLKGDKTVKLSLLRGLGLSPSRITKYNARHMLRSLAEVVRLGGYTGLLVAVDDMEILVSRSSLEPIRYTKLRREDTYESIRQLIDDIDSLKNIMFLFGFGRELLDNESAGIKSYQALWMRIQNEIVGQKFNCFTDIVDLDRLADQVYTKDVLVSMSRKMAEQLKEAGYQTGELSKEKAEGIVSQSRLGAVGMPRLVLEEVTGAAKKADANSITIEEDKESIPGGENHV